MRQSQANSRMPFSLPLSLFIEGFAAHLKGRTRTGVSAQRFYLCHWQPLQMRHRCLTNNLYITQCFVPIPYRQTHTSFWRIPLKRKKQKKRRAYELLVVQAMVVLAQLLKHFVGMLFATTATDCYRVPHTPHYAYKLELELVAQSSRVAPSGVPRSEPLQSCVSQPVWLFSRHCNSRTHCWRWS